MVLPSDSYPESRYKQQSYTVVEEGYGCPQTGYPCDTPVGYNSDSYNQCQQLPMGVKDDYSYSHNHGYKHGRPHGHSYDHSQGHKYEQHSMTTNLVGNMGFGGNQCPPGLGHGMHREVYTVVKETDD